MNACLLLALSAGLSVAQDAPEKPVVVMETSMGTVKIELYPDKAPITVKNFLAYVDEKFYDDTMFHRVISNFMVQAGGFKAYTEKATKAAIKNESANGLRNDRGTLAMARTPNPDSATAQFYINLKDNSFLDRANAQDGVGYCVFGRVIEGMNVIDKIAGVQTGTKQFTVKTGDKVPFRDVPVQEVLIKSLRKASK